ncbi:hypothetical protein OIU78_015309 [Salix suchowensis]|nr:hypothetical protein OIU78_015309 [Salix suchowensis]
MNEERHERKAYWLVIVDRRGHQKALPFHLRSRTTTSSLVREKDLKGPKHIPPFFNDFQNYSVNSRRVILVDPPETIALAIMYDTNHKEQTAHPVHLLYSLQPSQIISGNFGDPNGLQARG